LHDWRVSVGHNRADAGSRITDPDAEIAVHLSAADLASDVLSLAIDDDLATAGALLLPLSLVPDLLPEQPAKPATTVAAAAMPTKIRCFATGLLCLVADFCYVRA
jgi:hypothetical protein